MRGGSLPLQDPPQPVVSANPVDEKPEYRRDQTRDNAGVTYLASFAVGEVAAQHAVKQQQRVA